MHLKEILENKWLLYQYSDEKVFDMFDKWWQTLYFWVDPTADSMHIWHFTVFMNALNYMLKWNKLILIVWWATWMIWDPSWKDSERNFLDEETLQNNIKSLSRQMSKIVSNLEEITWKKLNYEIINNRDFYENMNFLDFLRYVWKYITVNQMMNKETVKRRIVDPEKSISYTEFSYMLIQAYDFLKLFKEKECKLQICWSDQWWNGVTWIELIRKTIDKEAYVVSAPLILDSNWKKFWKSEWNAIWIDENKSSPYFVYQYFMNCMDEDIEKFLNIYTVLEKEKIKEIVNLHNENPERRYWQQELAKNIICTIFWKNQAEQAEKISEIMFWKEDKLKILENMSENDIDALIKEVWWIEAEIWDKILDILTKGWLTSSNWEAKKMINSWAIYLNEKKVEWIDEQLNKANLINWKLWIIKKWKKNFKIIIIK